MEEIVRDARAKFFPVKLSDGIEARIVEPDKAMPFIMGHLNQVFGDRAFGGEWLNIQGRRQTRWQPLMERFSAVHTEFIFGKRSRGAGLPEGRAGVARGEKTLLRG